MRLALLLLVAVLLIAVLLIVTDTPSDPAPSNSPPRALTGPEVEDLYFDQWFAPYGITIPRDVRDAMQEAVDAFDPEDPQDDGGPNKRMTSTWEQIGPYSMHADGHSERYSGRIRDVEVIATEAGVTSLRIAAATGGLWEITTFPDLVAPLSDNVSSLAMGAFATNPSDEDHIIIGTGEPFKFAGTGLFVTDDRGVNWTSITMNPEPEAFYKIKYAPGSDTLVHAATTKGYYRSINKGMSWVRGLGIPSQPCHATDLALHPTDLDILYTFCYEDGFYKSETAGASWKKLDPIWGTGAGLPPTAELGRASIAVAPSQPDILYALIADTGQVGIGVFKSVDAGTTWVDKGPNDIIPFQGDYNNTIAVSPTDADIVLTGGVKLWRTDNGGDNWSNFGSPLHADQHVIEWYPDGQEVRVGNDGGLARSVDAGQNWGYTGNLYPITQYYNVDACDLNHQFVIGGAQDVGVSNSLGLTSPIWDQRQTGDGGGASGDSQSAYTDCNLMFATSGVFVDSDKPFRRYRLPTGTNMDEIDSGIEASDQWFPEIHKGYDHLYTHFGEYVYQSTNNGGSWDKLNPTAFPDWVRKIGISPFPLAGLEQVYAVMNTDAMGDRLKVYDGGTWFDRDDATLPSGTDIFIRDVVVSSLYFERAYLLMDGIDPLVDGKKVFKTTDRGKSWTNITGNLPNIPLSDIAEDPRNPDVLYLGSALNGMWRSLNGGTTWNRWDAGMPADVMVTRLDIPFFEFLMTGNPTIIAGTYGRSVWKRHLTPEPAPSITTGIIIPRDWSLRGLPASLGSGISFEDLFPANFSSAFRYHPEEGYIPDESPNPGEGFWIRMQEGVFAALETAPVDEYTAQLPKGWSLVGSVRGNAIPKVQPESALSSIFRYDPVQGYIQTNFIPHGEGVWLRCNVPCELIVEANQEQLNPNPGAAAKTSASPLALLRAEGEPVEGWIRESRVVLGLDPEAAAPIALPPPAPSSATTKMYLVGPEGEQLYQDVRLQTEETPLPIWTLVLDPNGDRVEPGETTLHWDPDTLRSVTDDPWILRSASDPDSSVLVADMRAASSVVLRGSDPLVLTLGPTGVSVDAQTDDVSDRFDLAQNYPNPFHEHTRIAFTLSETGPVTLRIFDVRGRLIDILVDEVRSSGLHTLDWHGRSANGARVPSGVYFYRLETSDAVRTRSLTLRR